MTDPRRSEMTALELFEAGVAALRALGACDGRVVVEVHSEDGRVRRVVPIPVREDAPRVTVGRRQLEDLRPAA